MTKQDLERVVALLERALTDAVAGGMVSVSIALTDQDGGVWVYQHKAGTTPARLVGPMVRVVQ